MTDTIANEPETIDLTVEENFDEVEKGSDSLKRKAENEEQVEATKKAKTDKVMTAKEKRELARIEKAKKKEEERQEKLERKRKLDEERELKRKQAEKEKEEKKKRQEEEKLERERKKEAERIQKEKEKQEKERIRLEKKKKIEEEKKAKELEKQRLEEEKRKAEEEKRKAEEAKERSQMKISSFFQVGQRVKSNKSTLSNKSSNTDDKTVVKSAYEKEFLPFFVQKNVTLANTSKNDITQSKNDLDNLLSGKGASSKQSFKEFLLSFVKPSRGNTTTITPEEIINALNSSTTTEQQVYLMIGSLPPIKYISFYENSKPPYVGTWCSLAHQKIQNDIINNPLNTDLSGLDYEYDSDLEWNKEDEEGEDLGNDDDDEEEEEESSTIEDDDDVEFVENDSQNGTKRKKFISLTVVNKWNDDENKEFFDSYTTVKLVDIPDPIDPFCNYWGIQPAPQQQSTSTTGVSSTINESNSVKTSATTVTGTISSPNILIAQKKTIKDADVLSNLIKFIEKNDEFTISTLVELSKKEFKDFTKALIKNTIQDIAIYNKKQSKWEIKQEMKEKYLVNV
ncbi:MAG: RLF2 family protein [Asgard group archaeon]|nr:RLF2 family protein [Asgard group archaeon]